MPKPPKNGLRLARVCTAHSGRLFRSAFMIGLDAVKRLDAKPRELMVLYYDSDKSPCACFADGIALATYASVGQRSLIIAPEKAHEDAAALIVIRPRQGGAGLGSGSV